MSQLPLSTRRPGARSGSMDAMKHVVTMLTESSAGESIAVLDEDTLWTAVDVARYLKVSRSWVYHRAEAGLLPYLRVGGLLRFEPEAIRRAVREEASRTAPLLKA